MKDEFLRGDNGSLINKDEESYLNRKKFKENQKNLFNRIVNLENEVSWIKEQIKEKNNL